MGPTPLLDFFRRGEVARDVRLTAAQGALAPRAHEQLAILVLLLDDVDPEIRETAEQTLNRIPPAALSAFLARSDVPSGLREFFARRGVTTVVPAAESADEPLVEAELSADDELIESLDDGEITAADPDAINQSVSQQIAKMTFSQRLKAAMKGSREMRAILVRDPNKMIAAAVLSSPKLSEPEVETISRMANVSEDVLRIIATNRTWLKNYSIVLGLTRNPKTPVALSLNLLNRLNDRDAGKLSIDRNVPQPVRIAARKRVVASHG